MGLTRLSLQRPVAITMLFFALAAMGVVAYTRLPVERYPNIKLVATTLREVHSANRHSWAAVLWLDGQRYVSPTCELDVLDRIGGGDGFAAGLIYGLLSGRAPEEALRLGWAHGALLTTFPGDVTMAKLPEVETLAKGGTARVQR